MNWPLYISAALNILLVVFISQLDEHRRIIGLARRFLQAPANAPYDVYTAISDASKLDHHAMFMIPPRKREEIGMLLEAMGGFKVGVELGVQAGGFAGIMLDTWKSCDKYYLVDLWSQQNNYHDWANVDNTTQEKALPFVPGLVDFIFVDARHDYCGAWEDMTLWWPKLRIGGVMAGHDYLHAAEVQGQDWSKCMDGMVEMGAVTGAVNKFVMMHHLQLSVTWAEDHPWRSWLVRKSHGGHGLHVPNATVPH